MVCRKRSKKVSQSRRGQTGICGGADCQGREPAGSWQPPGTHPAAKGELGKGQTAHSRQLPGQGPCRWCSFKEMGGFVSPHLSSSPLLSWSLRDPTGLSAVMQQPLWRGVCLLSCPGHQTQTVPRGRWPFIMSLGPKEGQSQTPHITELSTPTREEPPRLCPLPSCRGKRGSRETAGGRGAGGSDES